MSGFLRLASTMSDLRPVRATIIPRFSAVVVVPAPSFAEVMATTLTGLPFCPRTRLTSSRP